MENSISDEWVLSDPAERGIDPVLFSQAYADAARVPSLRGLLVVRHGCLVGERYYGGQDQHTVLNIKSVSKSILSALVGIALREGFLNSLDQTVAELLPEYFGPHINPRKRGITLRHLLTMSAGLRWVEDANHLRPWQQSSDWVKYALDRPLAGPPGRRFNYNTMLTHLVSVILARVSGMSTYTFADEYLLGLLGINIKPWTTDPGGYFIGGTDIQLTAREMAKIGQLYLGQGAWNGAQLIPADWVRESTRPQIALRHHGFWHPAYTDYGYYWWLRKLRGANAAVASGYGGQIIIVVPSLDVVVVTTADADVPHATVMQQSNRIEDFVETSVLSTIQE